MLIFKLSAPKTMRLLSGHILPRNASNFHLQPSTFEKFPPGEKPPEPLITGARKGKGGREGVNFYL